MKSFRERNPVHIGLIGTVVLIAIAAVVFFAKDLPIIGGGTIYRAEFSEAAGLRPDDEVRVAGIKVGEVTKVGLAEDRVLVNFRVRDALDGSPALSRTIASRYDQLAELLVNTRKISGPMAGSNADFDKLINDGTLLLTELTNRRDAIHALLVGTQPLATQLSGLVA